MDIRRCLTALALAALATLPTYVHAATGGTHVTPARTSVEGATSQFFTARFVNAAGAPAAGEAVTFTNDACGTFPNGLFNMGVTADANGVASILFTADPAGGVFCTVTAAAGVQVHFEVLTYTQAQIEIVVATPVVRPAPGAPYLFEIAVKMGLYTLYNVEVTALIFNGEVSAHFQGAGQGVTANTGMSGRVLYTVVPESAGVGMYTIDVNHKDLVRSVPIYFNAGFNFQGLWWVGEAENGWGVSIVQRDASGRLFVLIFTYDNQGNPTWYVIPDGGWTAGAASLSGIVYQPRGTPFYAYNAAAFDPGTPVGQATLTLTDESTVTFSYTIDGVEDVKTLVKFAYGADPAPTPPRVDDLYWGGQSQNGWGIPILQQDRALFSLWHTYGENGRPLWFSMPSGTWTSADTYEGRLYRTRGPVWLGKIYVAAALEVSDVGPFKLRFLANGTATFEYSVDGRTGTLSLVQFPF